MVERKRTIPWPASSYYKKGIIRFETNYSHQDGYNAASGGFPLVVKGRTLRQLQLETEKATDAYFSKDERPPIIELVLNEQSQPFHKLFDTIWIWIILGIFFAPTFVPKLLVPVSGIFIGVLTYIMLSIVLILLRGLFTGVISQIIAQRGFSTIGETNYVITVDGKYEIDNYTIRYTFQNHRFQTKTAWSNWSIYHDIPTKVKVSYLTWLPFLRVVSKIKKD